MPALLTCKIIAGSSKNIITGYHNKELVIKIKSQPEKGKANKELINFLATITQQPKTNISIIKGTTANHKIISFDNLTQSALEKIIQKHSAI